MNELAFDDLKLFARVAALGTLSAVAREREVPVSQVSRALSRIERACGARLLHRSTHGLSLTAEGETFLAHCHQLIEGLESLEGDFADTAGEVRGRVRVAASAAIAQHLLLPGLAELDRKHPQLRLEIEVSDQVSDLVRGGVDVAIRTASALPDTMVARCIGQLGRALYAAPSYLAQAGVPAAVEDLARHRLITNTAAPRLNHWPFMVDGRAVHWLAQGHWRCNDTGLVASMTLQGLGIGRLAQLVAQALVAEGRLVAILPQWVDPQPVPLYAVTATARQRLPKIRACIDHWLEQMSRLGDQTGVAPGLTTSADQTAI